MTYERAGDDGDDDDDDDDDDNDGDERSDINEIEEDDDDDRSLDADGVAAAAWCAIFLQDEAGE